METTVINEEGRVSLSEKTSITPDDIFQESQDCEISKLHTEVSDTQNEEAMQNFTDLDSISTICIETSDEEDVSEQSSTDIKQVENQFRIMTDLKSYVDYKTKLAYTYIYIHTIYPHFFKQYYIYFYYKNKFNKFCVFYNSYKLKIVYKLYS